MKTIKAWWWIDSANLGDVLTPYIIQKLTGTKVVHIGTKFQDAVLHILKRLYARMPIAWKNLHSIYLKEPSYILGIGSILGHKSDGNAIAWGSGFIREGEIFSGKQVLAVRGIYSEKELLKQGISKVGVYGDPALLLPLVYPCNPRKNGKVAIIPHFSEFSKFKKLYGERYDIIDFNTDDVEGVINQICSYSYILSSSLHGLIISHAYNIPAIWIEDKVLQGDTFHFKFRDYYSALGIEYYEPFHNVEQILRSDIQNFFETHKNKYTIKNCLSDIQRVLIRVAPFEVKEFYK